MTRSVKILHVLDHSLPVTDGYSMRSHNIIRNQLSAGLSPFALTSVKQGLSEGEPEIIEGVTYHRSSHSSAITIPVVSDLLLMRSLRARIDQLVPRERVDLIHVHSPVLNGLPALHIGQCRSLPVVYEMRALWEEGRIPAGQYRMAGMKASVSRGLETWLLKRVQAVTTICGGLKDEIVSRGVASEKVHVFPNGVDTDRYRAQLPNIDLKKRLGLEGCFVLGFIGSFYDWEGLDILIRSLKELSASLRNVRLVLVGGGEAEVEIRSQVSQLRLESHVIFTGKVPNAAVLDYYSIMDLCVYPRPKTRLTDCVTPLKPLEAMAAEKIVLASDVGGHRELIDDGKHGFLFRAGDYRDLASKVIELERNIPNLGSIRQQARQRVQRERNWASITSRYNALYEGLLDKSLLHSGRNGSA